MDGKSRKITVAVKMSKRTTAVTDPTTTAIFFLLRKQQDRQPRVQPVGNIQIEPFYRTSFYHCLLPLDN